MTACALMPTTTGTSVTSYGDTFGPANISSEFAPAKGRT